MTPNIFLILLVAADEDFPSFQQIKIPKTLRPAASLQQHLNPGRNKQSL
jgi:hypothetical protein